MKAKLSVASFLFVSFTLWSSICFAVCPNVVGIWKVTGNSVDYNSDNSTFGYAKGSGIFHIINQKACLFYGSQEDIWQVFTVSINGTEVTITDEGMIYHGQLRNLDPTTGQYKTIAITGSAWGGVKNMTGTMTRQ